jgi:hypothetical protein
MRPALAMQFPNFRCRIRAKVHRQDFLGKHPEHSHQHYGQIGLRGRREAFAYLADVSAINARPQISLN